jgi:hypothetical protein
MLGESADVYKQIILDEQARPITRRQIWLTNIKAYDNAIQPGRSDIARFRFRMPEERQGDGATGRRGEAGAVTLRARVNYRRLNQEHADYVLKRQNRKLNIPIVQMAEATVKLYNTDTIAPPPRRLIAPSAAKRWNDYGIGLLDQAQYGPAAGAFRRASLLDPNDPNLLVNIAIAERRTERFGPEREKWRRQYAGHHLWHRIQQHAVSQHRKVQRRDGYDYYCGEDPVSGLSALGSRNRADTSDIAERHCQQQPQFFRSRFND